MKPSTENKICKLKVLFNLKTDEAVIEICINSVWKSFQRDIDFIMKDSESEPVELDLNKIVLKKPEDLSAEERASFKNFIKNYEDLLTEADKESWNPEEGLEG